MMEVDYRKRGGELRQRTYDFSLRIINLWKSLPKGTEYEVIGKQLLRCGTSIGANYRAATVGKSDRDFLNKIRICQEEADESCYWLALLADSGMIQAKKLESIRDEANQITAIMTASAITIHKRILAEERNQNIPEKSLTSRSGFFSSRRGVRRALNSHSAFCVLHSEILLGLQITCFIVE